MGALRMPFQQVGRAIVLLAGVVNVRKKKNWTHPVEELNEENTGKRRLVSIL